MIIINTVKVVAYAERMIILIKYYDGLLEDDHDDYYMVVVGPSHG